MYSKKDFIKPSRLVYVNKSLPEKPPTDNPEFFDKLGRVIENNYARQLLFSKEMNETVAPIAKEKEVFEKALTEMREDLARLDYTSSVEKDIYAFGKTIHIVMDQNGTNQEYVDGQEVNFMLWALEQVEKN